MHYHAEVWIPEMADAEKLIAEAMAPYKEECSGEEVRGFWDWYQIGGRWTGEKAGYEPEKDPKNVERCYLCEGTGFRRDSVGNEARLSTPSYTCNGCGEYKDGTWTHGPHGPGRRVKWPTNWGVHLGDIAPVSAIKDTLKCYTLVVRGEAYSQERWTGDEWEKTDFDGHVAKKLSELGVTDGFLVTVDYHS